jgi:hypothetical protein
MSCLTRPGEGEVSIDPNFWIFSIHLDFKHKKQSLTEKSLYTVVKNVDNILLEDYIIFPGHFYLTYFLAKLGRAALSTPVWIRDINGQMK